MLNCEIDSRRIIRRLLLFQAYGKPRLESVIECFKELEKQLLVKEEENPFLKGFSTFMECRPNKMHFILAELLKLGANIVTTNYDQCIPVAYKCIVDKTDSMELYDFDEKNDGYYYFESKRNPEKCGRIYHIHGIASKVNSLGATISQLKAGLEEKFGIQLKRWLKDGYTFIYMGYGAGDTLDVNPFFESLITTYNAYGIYVEHSNQPEKVIHKHKSKNVMCLLKCFREKYIYRGDTLGFLKKLGIDVSQYANI